MKKLFMPSMDELYRMQDMGANIKLYLYAKVIEKLCIEYNNYCHKDSILKYEYNYLKEDEIIAHSICMMYPSEVQYSNVAKYDTLLVEALLGNINNDIYRLDNLNRFSNCALGNPSVMYKVLNILSSELKNNPKYRFEYKEGELLNNIFLGNINISDFCWYYDTFYENDILEKFARIEPYYAVADDKINDPNLLRKSVIDYINRYGFDYSYFQSNEDGDILTNQTTEVKRLFKCINR